MKDIKVTNGGTPNLPPKQPIDLTKGEYVGMNGSVFTRTDEKKTGYAYESQIGEVVVTGNKKKPDYTAKLEDLRIAYADPDTQRLSAKQLAHALGGKVLNREVNGVKQEIIVFHDSEGNKKRIDVDLVDLVEFDLRGKNEYKTPDTFKQDIADAIGQEELPTGVMAQYKHGKLQLFMGGEIMNENDIAQLKTNLETQRMLASLGEVKGLQFSAPGEELKPDLPNIEIAMNVSPAPQGARGTEGAPKPRVKREPAWKRMGEQEHPQGHWYPARARQDGGARYHGLTALEVAQQCYNGGGLMPFEQAKDKLVAIMVKQNPSVYNPDGSIKEHADFSKLDIPNSDWICEEYKGKFDVFGNPI